MRKVLLFGLALGLLISSFVACEREIITEERYPEDTTPPVTPRGVTSVTGNKEVTVYWYPSNEPDLAGYVVYRSLRELEDYEEIAEISDPKASSYVDTGVENGITYYYAVSSFDLKGNESDLSPEIVDDTPRPAGKNIRLGDYFLEPARSGFDFSHPEKGAVPFESGGVDIYFGVDPEVRVPYIYSDNDTIMQDLGFTESMDEVDASPTKGFTTLFVEAIIGHTYTFSTPDGHYAKLRVTDLFMDWGEEDIREAWVVFDWAYQLQPDNPELAPKRPTRKPTTFRLL